MLLLTEEQISEIVWNDIRFYTDIDIDDSYVLRDKILEKIKSISQANKINFYMPRQGHDDNMCITDDCDKCQARDMGCSVTKKFFGEV